VQVRITARYLIGHSKRRIAREEGVDPKTVGRILTRPEIVGWIARYRQELLSLVPRAIGVYDEALLSDDERIRVAVATKLVEGLQVMPRGNAQIGDLYQVPPAPTDEVHRRILGEIVDMTITKAGTHDIPLPKEWLSKIKAEEEARINAQEEAKMKAEEKAKKPVTGENTPAISKDPRGLKAS
jgi:hypothetical protein